MTFKKKKNKWITTRNLSSSLMPWYSFVPVVTTRFSTLKLLRTLALGKQCLLPRAGKTLTGIPGGQLIRLFSLKETSC